MSEKKRIAHLYVQCFASVPPPFSITVKCTNADVAKPVSRPPRADSSAASSTSPGEREREREREKEKKREERRGEEQQQKKKSPDELS